ncbi:MAG: glycosyltransferase family 2 protein, partial [Paracoccaceae bacterium]
TKVLPAVKEYKNQDVMILFCDDDKVYDPSWAQRFIQAAAERPGHAICEEGGHIKMPNYAENDWTSDRKPQAQFLNKNILYRVKRAVSLGTWKPSKGTSSGYVDILEGWGGVLVRPEFFDQLSFEIPELLWTVDDVWLSGCLERCAVPIWLNVKNKVRASANSNEIKDAALRNFVYNGYGRVAANRACIKYFQEKYRIWGG